MADVLADNLRTGREIGASIGVYSAGRPVVHIWGGLADPERAIAWGEHTLTPIASISKALATVALLVLADQSMIDFDEPVASYWPAFAQNGKSEIPVHLVLSQRSGVAAPNRFPPGDSSRWSTRRSSRWPRNEAARP